MRKQKRPKKKQWRDVLTGISIIATVLFKVLRLILFLWDRFGRH